MKMLSTYSQNEVEFVLLGNLVPANHLLRKSGSTH